MGGLLLAVCQNRLVGQILYLERKGGTTLAALVILILIHCLAMQCYALHNVTLIFLHLSLYLPCYAMLLSNAGKLSYYYI